MCSRLHGRRVPRTRLAADWRLPIRWEPSTVPGVMRRTVPLLVLAALAGCDPGVRVLNSAPRVTAVGPLTVDQGMASIVFWVRDPEEDAVDVSFYLVDGSTATPIDVTGGHGTIGLTTTREPTGKPHVVMWDTAGRDPAAQLQIRVLVTDDQGHDGPAFDTPSFTLQAGLPDP